MRLLVAALAAFFVVAAPAQAEQFGMMSPDDVVRALRCAPPRACKQSPKYKPPAQGGRALAAAVASYYARAHHGRRTANGERFDMHALTAAHKSLPFGTRLRVSRGNASVVVRINDRGPFVRGRDLDVSLAAARVLGLISAGVGAVTIERIN